jgi:hypothetical protein
MHLGKMQLRGGGAQDGSTAGIALLLAGAGSSGAGALAAGTGRVGGSTSGPLLPQPASMATMRENGSSKRDRRMRDFLRTIPV